MKANELRIGNRINSDRGIVEVAQLELYQNRIGVKSPDFTHFVWSNCDTLQPIPLTEDWHNKFGCKKDGFGSYVYKIRYNQTVVFSGDYVYLREFAKSIGPSVEDDMCVLWNKDFKKRDMYVNEWQNLFHSLTGEELEVKS